MKIESYVKVKRKKGKLRMKGRILNIQINNDKGDGLDPGSLFFYYFYIISRPREGLTKN